MDLRRGNNLEIIPQVVLLQRRIREASLALQEGIEDKITWKASGNYTARSAYNSQLPSQPTSAMKTLVWRIWAPGKIKFYLWLLHHNRLWCNDRLQRRGWENPYFCQLCCRNLESSFHLLWECNTSREVWMKAATWEGCAALSPASWSASNSTTEVVAAILNSAAPGERRGVKSMVALIAWQIWLERNKCTFRGKTPSTLSVIEACRRDVEQWRLAGAHAIAPPFEETT
ncbi:uncharacterized protein [Aegilops tauschii subsp. strangulata]|uniref:uncharacterized protein n=1 Tax=Aegilops tauschii subsp. strangulata TaxID=200361 RepID=UPI003CC8C457